ncbi:MAG: hypothetical protein CL949_22425, partial [Erythrobacter sp.]|nr:hypothetical protein [Erythrobacter sp.]
MSDNPLSAPNRCAIYTRKSTNSRLDHEVNSLTTQHEICSAYIASQRYRGWTALLLSIGVQTGPPIGAQKGPPFKDGATVEERALRCA